MFGILKSIGTNIPLWNNLTAPNQKWLFEEEFNNMMGKVFDPNIINYQSQNGFVGGQFGKFIDNLYHFQVPSADVPKASIPQIPIPQVNNLIQQPKGFNPIMPPGTPAAPNVVPPVNTGLSISLDKLTEPNAQAPWDGFVQNWITKHVEQGKVPDGATPDEFIGGKIGEYFDQIQKGMEVTMQKQMDLQIQAMHKYFEELCRTIGAYTMDIASVGCMAAIVYFSYMIMLGSIDSKSKYFNKLYISGISLMVFRILRVVILKN